MDNFSSNFFPDSKSIRKPLLAIGGVIALAGIYTIYKRLTGTKNHKLQILDCKDINYDKKNPLTYSAALYRSQIITNVEYYLTLNLRKGETYQGFLKVNFVVNQVQDGLFLDFFGKLIKHISINDKDYTDRNLFMNHSISFLKESLKKGLNQVIIAFETNYVHDGSGLHSFVDPADGLQYLWSQCEPIYAHRIFPCFDQPDIKAKLQLNVIAPIDWRVIANEKELSIKEIPCNFWDDYLFTYNPDEDCKLWTFQITPPIASYLYAIISGPYAEIKNPKPYKKIKMSVFYRQSMLKFYMYQAPTMFESTSWGIEYYEAIFGQPYPFSKYDMIFCPEFNWGAMENVGAVTYSEAGYLFKEEPDNMQLLGLSLVCLHELAHMWFGNLVTMKWWDDLWLNESFATFIAYHTASNVPVFKAKYQNVWLKFFFYKERGYNADRLSTTHPISWKVENTSQCETQFDSITYSKGASVLKQLVYVIGFENFTTGLKHYFTSHKWRNTELIDFFRSMKNALSLAGLIIDLDSWQNDWIQTAGFNELEASIELYDDNKFLHEITITQKACLTNHPKLRNHKLKIALYYDDMKSEIITADLNDTLITKLSFEKKKIKAPSALLLNYGDEDFVKIRIDNNSLKFFQKNIGKITEPLSRGLIWKAFGDMVYDGKLSTNEYLNFFRENIHDEDIEVLVSSILLNTASLAEKYLPNDLNIRILPGVFDKLYEIMCEQYNKNNNIKIAKLILNNLSSFAIDDKSLLKLKEILMNKGNGVTFSKDLKYTEKWIIFLRCTAKEILTQTEKQEILSSIDNNTDQSMRNKLKLSVLEVKNPEERLKLWKSFIHREDSESVKQKEAQMLAFNNSFLSKINAPFAEKFFDDIVKVYETNNYDYFKAFYHALFPFSYENLDFIIAKLEDLIIIASNASYSPLLKFAKESLDQTYIRRRNIALVRSKFQYENDMEKLGEQVMAKNVVNEDQAKEVIIKEEVLDNEPKNKTDELASSINKVNELNSAMEQPNGQRNEENNISKDEIIEKIKLSESEILNTPELQNPEKIAIIQVEEPIGLQNFEGENSKKIEKANTESEYIPEASEPSKRIALSKSKPESMAKGHAVTHIKQNKDKPQELEKDSTTVPILTDQGVVSDLRDNAIESNFNKEDLSLSKEELSQSKEETNQSKEEMSQSKEEISPSKEESKGEFLNENLNIGNSRAGSYRSWGSSLRGFEKENSIFADWREPTDSTFLEMLTKDLSKMTMDKYITTEEIESVVQALQKKYYANIFYVFLFFQAESKRYPEVNWIDFCHVLKDRKITSAFLTVRDLDNIYFNETKKSLRNSTQKSTDRTLNRYEFIEIVLRLGIKKYHHRTINDKVFNTAIEAIQYFLDHDFKPLSDQGKYEYEDYRKEWIFKRGVNNLLMINHDQLKTIFDQNKTNEYYMKLIELEALLMKKKFDLEHEDIINCFALSKSLVIQEIPVGSRSYESLEFVEFLSCLVRIADLLYEDKQISITKKLEKFLGNLIDSSFKLDDHLNDDDLNP